MLCPGEVAQPTSVNCVKTSNCVCKQDDDKSNVLWRLVPDWT
eukprot:SAG22_NODE_4812_length_1158_cov_1.361662_1_plen_41_part_10